jgi:hypothetical protein
MADTSAHPSLLATNLPPTSPGFLNSHFLLLADLLKKATSKKQPAIRPELGWPLRIEFPRLSEL